MKTVHLREITSKGLDLPLDQKEEWVLDILRNAISETKLDQSSIKGNLHLHKTEQIIDLTGNILFTYFPLCAHCGQEVKSTERINLHATLAPLYTSPAERKKGKENNEEIELTKDDTEFSFYENDEIEVHRILNDEILLSLPYNYYCADKEKCEQAKPHDEHITVNDTIDPRWLKLKNLKIGKN